MTKPRPLQLNKSQANLIWTDGPYKNLSLVGFFSIKFLKYAWPTFLPQLIRKNFKKKIINGHLGQDVWK